MEVQALVAPTAAPAPRRTASGVDPNRLALLVAVLGRRAGTALGQHDVYANLAGGLSVSEPFTIAGSGSGSGALLNVANSNTVTGAVTLSSAATIGSTAGTLTFDASGNAFDASSGTPAITFTGAGNITVSDPIDTPISTLTKSGVGVLVLAAVNAYTSTTTIDAGTLRLSGSGSVPDLSAVSITNSGTFDLNNVNDTVGSISSSGASTSTMTGDACAITTSSSDFAQPAASVATETTAGTWRLTPALNSQFGAIWNKVKWNTNFDLCIRAELNLGTRDSNGADGIAFVIQPGSATALGGGGGGMGTGGTANLGGGGGGKDDLAQGGGVDTAKISEAISRISESLRSLP